MSPEAAEIAFNPLPPLRDDSRVRDVFSRILAQRFDTSILDGLYDLGAGPTDFDLFSHVSVLVEYLVSIADQSPLAVAEGFWERFALRGSGYPGVPGELRPILKSYYRVKEDRTDLIMIKDLFMSGFPQGGIVADIGCGRNKLGAAVLRYLGTSQVKCDRVIGTDPEDYRSSTSHPQLEFRRAPAVNKVPIEDGIVDLAIIKWALHHMDDRILDTMVAEVSRILKPGGRLAVIETLMGDSSALNEKLKEELTDKETWPPGDWFSTRLKLTQDYLALSQNQQKCVLALEDFYGHWLEQRHTWMPQPFNHLPPDSWVQVFEKSRMQENGDARRVFGMMPIIHWGPPTVRVVLTKPPTNE